MFVLPQLKHYRLTVHDMEPKAYKSGEIVWVLASKRLGWWPARVENVDLLRSDFKKEVSEKTLAVVKYLNEDNYHFIEDAAIICAYNSSCKEEYISLGMSKYQQNPKLLRKPNSEDDTLK